jgi:hypothetical protein
MDMMAAGVGMLLNLFFLGMLVAAVMKLFQVHTTLTEIKDLLAKAPAPVYVPPAHTPQVYAQPVYAQPAAQPVSPQTTLRMPPQPAAPIVGDARSGEEMLRELDAQMRIEEASRLKPPL